MAVDANMNRIGAKFPLRAPLAELDLQSLIPAFHGWIQRGDVTAGLDIDVADYSHVPDGPGVMLIGHEWDRSVDIADGRPGVLSVAKRGLEGDLAARVATVVADALRTAATLADAEWQGDGWRVLTGEVEITLLDRVSAPNTDAALAELGPVIAGVLAPLNGGTPPELVRIGDERRPFRVRAVLAGAPEDAAEAADLLTRAVSAG
jgi:hypothetical protein